MVRAMVPPGGSKPELQGSKPEASVGFGESMASSTPGEQLRGLLDVQPGGLLDVESERGLLDVGCESDPAASDPTGAGGEEEEVSGRVAELEGMLAKTRFRGGY